MHTAILMFIHACLYSWSGASLLSKFKEKKVVKIAKNTIINENQNSIHIRTGQSRNGDVTITAISPTSDTTHTWTLLEIHEIVNLLDQIGVRAAVSSKTK